MSKQFYPCDCVFAGWNIIGDFELDSEGEALLVISEIVLRAQYRGAQAILLQVEPNSSLWDEIEGDFLDSPDYADAAAHAGDILREQANG